MREATSSKGGGGLSCINGQISAPTVRATGRAGLGLITGPLLLSLHRELRMTQKLCFVIGPIGRYKSDERAHADRLLKEVIKPTFSKHFRSFKVERADQIARPGMIDSQVITHLIEADLVVADLTTRNANAFYELGIRHMLQKPIIHLFRRGDDIPTDVAPYRAVEFAYDDKQDIRDAKVALRKAVTEVLRPGFQIENPITRSAGFLRMENAKGRERGHVASMAAALQSPVEEVRKRLEAFSKKTVTLKFKPSYFNELLAPLQHFDKQWNDLVVAIAGIGAQTHLYKGESRGIIVKRVPNKRLKRLSSIE